MDDRTPATPLTVTIPLMTLVPGGMGGTQTFVTEVARGLHEHPLVDLTVGVPRAAAGLTEIAPFRVVGDVPGGPSNLDRLVSQLCAELSATARGLLRDPTSSTTRSLSRHRVRRGVCPTSSSCTTCSTSTSRRTSRPPSASTGASATTPRPVAPGP